MLLKSNQDNRSINRLLESSFSRFGTRPAIKDEKQEMTYHELNLQAEHFSRRLASLNMPQKSVVGVFMDGSIDYVITVLPKFPVIVTR